MINIISKYRWLFTLRGFLAVIFGLAALFLQGVTFGTLVIAFGLYVLIEGILLIGSALGQLSDKHWPVVLIQGIASMFAWVLMFTWPVISRVVLLCFIAAWAVITGVLEIISSISILKEIRFEWELGLSGIVSIIFALILIASRSAGTHVAIGIIGIYAVAYGALTISVGYNKL